MTPPTRAAPSLVDGLPAELILIICKFAHLTVLVSRQPPMICADPNDPEGFLTVQRPPTEWNERDDIHSLGLFPYALASLSTLWRDLMGTVPEFWTRIVIHVDSPDFSLPFVRSQLEWSRDLPIDVTVTRRAEDAFADTPDEERARLREIIDIVSPHVWRCKTIRYEVTYTSSLPCIAADFYGDASLLKRLELVASRNNGFGGSTENRRNEGPPFSFPILNTLALDGWNFVDLFTNTQDWFDKFLKTDAPIGKKLSLSHYQSADGEALPKFSEVWPLFREMRSLHLENMHFDAEACSRRLDNNFCTLNTLHVKDLDSSLTVAVLCQPGFIESLHIVRCPLLGVQDINMCHSLTLEGIEDAASMCELLASWTGVDLFLRDCPGFDDSVLDVLGTPMRDRAGRIKKFNAPRLSSLVLYGTCGFSIPALRKMVQGRQIRRDPRYPGDDDLETSDAAKMHSIYGRGVEGLDMSSEDQAWFSRNLSSFEWYS